MSSKSITIILSYTVSKLVHFLRHSVVQHYLSQCLFVISLLSYCIVYRTIRGIWYILLVKQKSIEVKVLSLYLYCVSVEVIRECNARY